MRELPQAHPLYEKMKRMVLCNINFEVFGGTATTKGCDAKHACKRLKEAVKKSSEYSIFGADGFKMSGAFLRQLVSDYREVGAEEPKWPASKVSNMCRSGFADAQSVPFAIFMMQAVASFADCSIENFPSLASSQRGRAVFAAAKPTLEVLSKYLGWMLMLLTTTSCTVDDHLRNLADLSLLLFVLFHKNGTGFVPAQNYHNTQSMIKSIFLSVLAAQLEGIEEYSSTRTPTTGSRCSSVSCVACSPVPTSTAYSSLSALRRP